MLSAFIFSECCDAPLMINQKDFLRDLDIVECAGCHEPIGIVTDEDWSLLCDGITPGDIYADPNDSGRHHRMDYSKIDPTELFPMSGVVSDILAVPVPAPDGVWIDPNDMPSPLLSVEHIPDDDMRRMLRDFEARHRGEFSRVTYMGGEDVTTPTPDDDDDRLTERLRDAVREYVTVVAPAKALAEHEELLPVVRHREDDEDDTSYRERHNDEPVNDPEETRQTDPGPDTREEPESLSEADFRSAPGLFANDTERIRWLIRNRMQFNPWNGSAMRGVSPFVTFVA